MAKNKENISEDEVETENKVPDVELPVVPLFGKWNLTEVNTEDKTLEFA